MQTGVIFNRFTPVHSTDRSGIAEYWTFGDWMYHGGHFCCHWRVRGFGIFLVIQREYVFFVLSVQRNVLSTNDPNRISVGVQYEKKGQKHDVGTTTTKFKDCEVQTGKHADGGVTSVVFALRSTCVISQIVKLLISVRSNRTVRAHAWRRVQDSVCRHVQISPMTSPTRSWPSDRVAFTGLTPSLTRPLKTSTPAARPSQRTSTRTAGTAHGDTALCWPTAAAPHREQLRRFITTVDSSGSIRWRTRLLGILVPTPKTAWSRWVLPSCTHRNRWCIRCMACRKRVLQCRKTGARVMWRISTMTLAGTTSVGIRRAGRVLSTLAPASLDCSRQPAEEFNRPSAPRYHLARRLSSAAPPALLMWRDHQGLVNQSAFRCRV